jgi:transposase
VLHADETPVQQLEPGNGKTKRAHLWAFRSNALGGVPSIVVFDYQLGQGGKYVAEFLRDWQGALMVDEFAGYQVLFRGEVIELACLAHARRKFFDLHQANGSPVAAEALRRFAALYAIEAAAKGKTVESIELSPVRDAKGAITHDGEWPQRLPVRSSLADAQGLTDRPLIFIQMMEMVRRVAPSDAAISL